MALDDEEILDEEEEEYNITAIVIAAVLILALVGGGAWYLFLREPPPEAEQLQAQLPVWEPPETVEEDRVFENFPRMIINPADSKGRYYLVIKIDIAYNTNFMGEVLSKPWLLPKAQNLMIDIFSSYTIEQLRNPKIKEEARLLVKEDFNILLGWKENAAVTGDENLPPIKEIYLIEYILQ